MNLKKKKKRVNLEYPLQSLLSVRYPKNLYLKFHQKQGNFNIDLSSFISLIIDPNTIVDENSVLA